MRITTFIGLLFFSMLSYGQKIPLDHSVYDGWQNIAERLISDNGAFVAFTVVPQEGDGLLYIKKKVNKENPLHRSSSSHFFHCRKSMQKG